MRNSVKRVLYPLRQEPRNCGVRIHYPIHLAIAAFSQNKVLCLQSGRVIPSTIHYIKHAKLYCCHFICNDCFNY